MVTDTLDKAMELQWISKDDVTLEDYSFSIKTGLRDTGDYAAMHTLMVNLWTSSVGAGLLNGATLTTTRLNNWETSGGFTGWHQLDTLPQSVAGGGASRLPTQLCVVISFLNTTQTSVALGRRRSRCYFGPSPASMIDGSGKITTGNITDFYLNIAALQGSLLATPSTVTAVDGIGVVSPTQGAIMEATSMGVGRQMDTHRSRRQKAVEAIVYATL